MGDALRIAKPCLATPIAHTVRRLQKVSGPAKRGASSAPHESHESDSSTALLTSSNSYDIDNMLGTFDIFDVKAHESTQTEKISIGAESLTLNDKQLLDAGV